MNINILNPNMFFTFSLLGIGIYCIFPYLQKKKCDWKVLTLGGACLFVGAICGEYALYALAFFASYLLIENKILKYIPFIFATMILCVTRQEFMQFFMILALLPIGRYVDVKPKQKLTYFFYLFYPLHIWGLMVIRHFIFY